MTSLSTGAVQKRFIIYSRETFSVKIKGDICISSEKDSAAVSDVASKYLFVASRSLLCIWNFCHSNSSRRRSEPTAPNQLPQFKWQLWATSAKDLADGACKLMLYVHPQTQGHGWRKPAGRTTSQRLECLYQLLTAKLQKKKEKTGISTRIFRPQVHSANLILEERRADLRYLYRCYISDSWQTDSSCGFRMRPWSCVYQYVCVCVCGCERPIDARLWCSIVSSHLFLSICWLPKQSRRPSSPGKRTVLTGSSLW